MGVWCLPVIFIMQLANGLYFIGSINAEMFLETALACLAIGLPIILLNKTLKQPPFLSLLENKIIDVSLFWLFLSLALITSLLNSLTQSFVIGAPNNQLLWYYLLGDIAGSIGFFIFIVLMLKLKNGFFRMSK